MWDARIYLLFYVLGTLPVTRLGSWLRAKNPTADLSSPYILEFLLGASATASVFIFKKMNLIDVITPDTYYWAAFWVTMGALFPIYNNFIGTKNFWLFLGAITVASPVVAFAAALTGGATYYATKRRVLSELVTIWAAVISVCFAATQTRDPMIIMIILAAAVTAKYADSLKSY